MAVTLPAEDRLAAAADRLAPVAVPVGLAVVTWLTLLLAAGVLLRPGSLSLSNLVPLFFVGLLLWPVYRAAPWRDGTAARVLRWVNRSRAAFAVLAVLFVLPAVPLVPDLLISLLQLPYRGSGLFFGASLFYRERLGPTAARLLLRFGQWYFQALWLYLLATILVGLGRRLR